jgi:YgiT-type zinc finger domain-containing protein
MKSLERNQLGGTTVEHHCTNCGSTARTIHGNHLFRASGLNNIILEDIDMIKCENCGNEEPIIARINGVLKTIALALINKPFALCGEEIRYLRKYLGMSGDTFSTFLQTDKSVLSRWENNRELVGARSDLLIRMIALSLGTGLRPEVEQSVRKFPKIDESPKALNVKLDLKDLTFEFEPAFR